MQLKICSLCKIEKPLENFNKNYTKKDGYQSFCKVCSMEKSKSYYISNKESHKNKTKEQRNAIRQRNSQFLWDYLSTHGCVDCGNNNPIVLEFDHVSGIKTSEVSILAQDMWAISSIEEEIAKCEVRCANCHRIKTAKQFNWYKNINMGP